MPAHLKPLLAVDGDNLAHRAWHALPDSIRDAQKKPANALIGFTNMLLSVWEMEQPRTVFVGFDTVGSPTYRNELLPEYQTGRVFPKELTDQLDRLTELVPAFGFAWGKQEGYEADDFLAAAVASEEARGGETVVLTNDRDMFQLASKKTTILLPGRRFSELTRVGPPEVVDRYGVTPEQVPDRPRDHVIGRLEVALALVECARQGGREVASDGGLLGDDERLCHEVHLSEGLKRQECPRT